MNIGNLKANADGIVMGRITTLSVAMTVALRPVASSNEKAPAFDMMALSADRRQWISVGGLWEFTSTATGEAFLSGRIDDPSLAKPLDVALFRQQDGSYNVAWRRPQTRSALPTTAATSGGDELPPFPGDAAAPAGGPDGGGDGLGESTAPAPEAKRRGAKADEPVTA
ncbi:MULTISPECIES: DUF736 domain-containing protein [unclassified Sphingomonas]|uniref:DUF736 domain-containing protein n=1 Tax=unclassified Sphingomonas TaxID=196159 RepID=UPI0009274139|nr:MULTISPECIES: DUF736 domain-containing protein [unclassified Sphingomonas]MBN8847363.1 DUF736 domain-containing protein [Sphingomonas sp.]OJV28230.1 MAG: hypothetical protein BGO24_07820 [Sphingomonas sp. 67-36]